MIIIMAKKLTNGVKKLVSLVLVLCMFYTMIPSIPTVFAAESDAGYRYELDTDGIDIGAQYLIVSGTVTNSSALRFDASTI